MIWKLWKKTGWIFFQLNSITSQKAKCQVYFCIKKFFSCDSDEIQNNFSGSGKTTLSEFHYSISIVAKNDSKKSKSCYEIMKTQKKPWVLLPQQIFMELHYFDARFLRWIEKKTINDAEAIFDQKLWPKTFFEIRLGQKLLVFAQQLCTPNCLRFFCLCAV